MKQEKSRHSLQWRISLFVTVFVIFTVFILWLFQVVLLEGFYREIKLREIQSFSNVIVKTLDKEENTDDMKIKIDSIIAYNDHSLGINIYLVSKNEDNYKYYAAGNVVSGTFKPSEEVMKNLWTSAKQCNFDSFFVDATKLLDYELHGEDELRFNLGQEILYGQFFSNQDQEYMLMLNSELVPVSAAKHTLQVQLILITIILLCFGILLSYIMGKFISQPLVDLTKSAKLLAGDRKNLKFTGTGYLEVKELSDTLNYATREIEKSENLQKDLISNVSHELRTPLTLIAGYSEMMKDIKSEQTEENFNLIINETKRLSNLVNDILTLSKLQSKVQNVEFDEYNITASIEDVISSFSKQAQDKNISLTFSHDKEYNVFANELQISQVIYNFIANAINYSKDTDDHQDIIVKQELTEEGLKISVRDFGIGIKPEDLDNIWSRYYKVYDDQKKKNVGSGLGLAIVKEILETHKFKYGCESTYTETTVFWFTIPKEKVEGK